MTQSAVTFVHNVDNTLKMNDRGCRNEVLHINRKNIEVFEVYKALWAVHRTVGIRANSMSEGIEKAIEIEKYKTDELFFIDIVAGDIDYMPQLKILSEETDAPILIATSDYSDDERERALTTGADFFGKYCDTSGKDINAVIAVINSIDRRETKKRTPSQIMVYKGLLIDTCRYQHGVFVDDQKIESLTRQDFDLLYYLMKNRGKVLTYNQIYTGVWNKEYEEGKRNGLWNAITRLRDKLKPDPGGTEYIETVRDVGYCVPLDMVK